MARALTFTLCLKTMRAERTPTLPVLALAERWTQRLPSLALRLLQELLLFVYPPTCAGCALPLSPESNDSFCLECQENLELIGQPYCPVCGMPFLGEGPSSHLCGDCLSDIYHFDRARAAGIYRGLLREVIQRFKYEGKTFLVRPLAQLVTHIAAGLADNHDSEFIVPVPLHPRRLRQRGFNQVSLLARQLGSKLRLPVDYSLLKRSRWTEPQTGLSRKQRAKNVKGAFDLSNQKKVRGKNVLLLDDVFTTGETVNQCVRVLRDGGAREVTVLTVARTVTM